MHRASTSREDEGRDPENSAEAKECQRLPANPEKLGNKHNHQARKHQDKLHRVVSSQEGGIIRLNTCRSHLQNLRSVTQKTELFSNNLSQKKGSRKSVRMEKYSALNKVRIHRCLAHSQNYQACKTPGKRNP